MMIDMATCLWKLFVGCVIMIAAEIYIKGAALARQKLLRKRGLHARE